MRNHLASPLLLGLLLTAGAASADDVYLQNGRKFEGVIAETTDTQVRIRMQGGVVSLPKSQVLRVESKDSDLSGYLRRKEALRRNAGTRAEDWLELARWAKAQGLDQGAREAALLAADLDPKLEGVTPLLRGYKYTFDEQLGRWISYEESMRRRGFLYTGGAWISREELAERERLRQEAEAQSARIREAARAERAARQTEMLLATQTALLEETIRDRQRETAYASPYAPYTYGWPVVVVPGFFPPRCHHGDCGGNNPPSGGGDGGGGGHHGQPGNHSGFTRIPGSLIPGGDAGRSSSSPER
jgi:hypothetical protein